MVSLVPARVQVLALIPAPVPAAVLPARAAVITVLASELVALKRAVVAPAAARKSKAVSIAVEPEPEAA